MAEAVLNAGTFAVIVLLVSFIVSGGVGKLLGREGEPVETECPRCGGYGRHGALHDMGFVESSYPCGACKGTGKVKAWR